MWCVGWGGVWGEWASCARACASLRVCMCARAHVCVCVCLVVVPVMADVTAAVGRLVLFTGVRGV